MWRPIVKTLIFTVVVPGTVTILIPRWLHSAATPADLPATLRFAGWPTLCLGIVVYLSCAWDFAVAGRGTPAPIDPPKALVARGLYKHVRNPMYLGILSILVGEAFVVRSRVLLAYAGAVWLLFFLFVLLYEEPALQKKFGAAYERYRREVPRWIPGLRKAPEAEDGS
jgi:protein-S-isoprenylcysteine O-methyltransferase Ste14